jgi:hypothetical protein
MTRDGALIPPAEWWGAPQGGIEEISYGHGKRNEYGHGEPAAATEKKQTPAATMEQERDSYLESTPNLPAISFHNHESFLSLSLSEEQTLPPRPSSSALARTLNRELRYVLPQENESQQRIRTRDHELQVLRNMRGKAM